MKFTLLIPIAAGILFPGQLLAAEPQTRPAQVQPDRATVFLPAASESIQAAQALPLQLSLDEMDRVTAGVGRENVGNEAWTALAAAGFSLNHNFHADKGLIDHAGFDGTAVPSAVPGTACVAFC